MTFVLPSRTMKDGLEQATQDYQLQLKESPGEQSLLSRGITRESLEDFRLGYVANPSPGDDRFEGHIAIPYLTVSGVVTMRFRRVIGEGSRYNGHSGAQAWPFNVRALQTEGPIFVCEGELDAIVATQCGLPAIAFPGANSWKRVYGRMLRFHEVYVLADGDEAGRKFAEAVARDVPGTKIAEMPPGEDVNSVFLSSGEMGLREWAGLIE